MPYTIDWIGTVALGVRTEGGRPLAFSLERHQRVPDELKEGDAVEITNHPDHPSVMAAGLESCGYYEITHIKSGKVLKTWYRAAFCR